MIKKISFTAIISAFILSSCSSPGGSGVGSNFEPTFTITETARFGNSEDVSISAISNIMVASDGTTLVSDGRSPAIYMFDAAGSYIGTVGNVGRGPGEFDAPPSIALFENDSLFVYDRSLMRATIFARNDTSWSYARDFVVTNADAGEYQLSSLVKLPAMDGYVTSEQIAVIPENLTNPSAIRYRIVAEDGSVLKAEYASRSFPESVAAGDPGSVTVAVLPFGWSSFIRFENGGTYYLGAKSDKLVIDQFDVDGNRVGGIDVPVVERPITDADKQLDPRAANPVVSGQLPANHPAYVSFLVSDIGNYWVNIGQIDASSTYWVVVNPQSEVLGSTIMPATARPVRIVDGKMYVANQGSTAEPEVVIYDVEY